MFLERTKTMIKQFYRSFELSFLPLILLAAEEFSARSLPALQLISGLRASLGEYDLRIHLELSLLLALGLYLAQITLIVPGLSVYDALVGIHLGEPTDHVVLTVSTLRQGPLLLL